MLLFLALLFYILVIPRLSSAEVEFVSSPVVKSGEDSTTFFESSRFRFSSEEKSVSFHVSGESAGMWDLAEPDSSDDGLDYAYLTMRSRLFRTDLSLGRIEIDEGSIEEQLDGIYSRTRLTEKTRLSLFSGRTTASATDLTGGRLRYKLNDHTVAGIFYLTESDGSQMLREEAAIDLHLRPFTKTVLSGGSLFDLRTGNWSAHSYSAKIGPFQKATFLFDASFGNYEDSPSVRPPSAGGGIRYSVTPHLAVGFTVHRTEDSFVGPVLSERVRLSWSSLHSWNAAASIGHHRGPDFDAVEWAAHASKKAGNLESSLNLRQTLDRAGLGTDGNATSATLGLAYQLSPSYKLVADLQETKSRDAEAGFRGFVKLEYRFGS